MVDWIAEFETEFKRTGCFYALCQNQKQYIAELEDKEAALLIYATTAGIKNRKKYKAKVKELWQLAEMQVINKGWCKLNKEAREFSERLTTEHGATFTRDKQFENELEITQADDLKEAHDRLYRMGIPRAVVEFTELTDEDWVEFYRLRREWRKKNDCNK